MQGLLHLAAERKVRLRAIDFFPGVSGSWESAIMGQDVIVAALSPRDSL